ncbi:glycosyl transferase [Bacteroidia bacterium]|nr:glycosyl transferase [Bacteroidia bacterium]
MNYKASVIISIYNNIPFLKAVLDTLKLQTEKDFEIIISEDACHESVKDFVQNYPFENDYQHLTQPDIGWRKNQALNNAIRSAKADWLIFVDGDCVLHPRFVEMHLRYAGEKNIVAGKRVKLDEAISQFILQDSSHIRQLQSMLLKKMLTGKGRMKYVEEGIFISPDGCLGFIPRMRKIRHLIGSNMAFSKKTIAAINGFDEDYILPAFGEDTDLLWRFQALGYQLVSVRNMAVQYHLNHRENWTEQETNLQIYYQKQANKEYICYNGLVKKDKP